MLEFVIVAPVMLLLILGALQFAFLYHAKITLNYAAFQAARAGAVANARFDAIAHGFASGMAPLRTNIDAKEAKELPLSAGTVTLTRIQKLNQARQRFIQDVDDDYVCIQRINPTAASFLDSYADTDADGNPVIPNDNLIYRNPKSGSSGLSIQDANLLKLRITYCHPMIVPFANRVIASLALATEPNAPGNWSDPPGSGTFRRACLEADSAQNQGQPRLPIVAQAIVRMQSPATWHPDDEWDPSHAGFRTSCD
jgi:hypothetical protein